jgi:hypothetical protein
MIEKYKPKFKVGDIIIWNDAGSSIAAEVIDIRFTSDEHFNARYDYRFVEHNQGTIVGEIASWDCEQLDRICHVRISPSKIWKELNDA